MPSALPELLLLLSCAVACIGTELLASDCMSWRCLSSKGVPCPTVRKMRLPK